MAEEQVVRQVELVLLELLILEAAVAADPLVVVPVPVEKV